MTCTLREGHRTWSGSIDDEGHVTYEVAHMVESDPTDGPHNVSETPGLPEAGALWHFDDDYDPWAFCLPGMKIDPSLEDEPNTLWVVKQKFSTKAPERRCNDEKPGDPLLEPAKVSGSYNKTKEEATFDMFGMPAMNSAWEEIHGPQLEFDKLKMTVKIEQNVATFDQAVTLPASMKDCVNGTEIWGFPTRTIKLSPGPWEKKYYGRCWAYYTRVLEFEIDLLFDLDGFPYSGHDRKLLDEGSKALHGENRQGKWVITPLNDAGDTPDYQNPSHFVKYKDAHQELSRCVLNGFGRPVDLDLPGTGTGTALLAGGAGSIDFYKYQEADFSQLGIPLTL